MKPIALCFVSLLILTGCSSLIGDENDTAACKELAQVVSVTNVALGSLTPAVIAERLRLEILPLAGQALTPRIEALAAALETEELDTAQAGAAASDIGVRCALVGVTFDFTVIGQLLNYSNLQQD